MCSIKQRCTFTKNWARQALATCSNNSLLQTSCDIRPAHTTLSSTSRCLAACLLAVPARRFSGRRLLGRTRAVPASAVRWSRPPAVASSPDTHKTQPRRAQFLVSPPPPLLPWFHGACTGHGVCCGRLATPRSAYGLRAGVHGPHTPRPPTHPRAAR